MYIYNSYQLWFKAQQMLFALETPPGIFLHFWSQSQGLLNLGKKYLDHQSWESLMQSKRTWLHF